MENYVTDNNGALSVSQALRSIEVELGARGEHNRLICKLENSSQRFKARKYLLGCK